MYDHGTGHFGTYTENLCTEWTKNEKNILGQSCGIASEHQQTNSNAHGQIAQDTHIHMGMLLV